MTHINQYPTCPIERFFAKVRKTETCWLWVGLKDEKGYGLFKDGGRIRTHRWSYRHHCGEIPEGMYVCHRCDVPSCVNPGHLFLGTPKENTQDMLRKGRQRRSSAEHRAKRLTSMPDDILMTKNAVEREKRRLKIISRRNNGGNFNGQT